MQWMFWTGIGVLVLAGVVWRAVRASRHAERKRTISWWSGRNGFRYTRDSSELLDLLRGAPFDRGTRQEIQDVLSGPVGGRAAMLLQFSWYHLPAGGHSEHTGASGIRSGVCAAAVIELPAPVPELLVRRETGLDRARGRDLQLESVQFNAAFRINATDDKFAYDILHPRMMEWLLADERAARYSFRFDGSILVVWQDSMVTDPARFGQLADFAATLLGHVPDFVFGTGHRPGPDQTSVRISQLPAAVLGPTPVGAVAFLQHLEHRGHRIERYEHVRNLWNVKATTVSVKINLPTVWPVLMLAPKHLAKGNRIPRFDDGVVSGDTAFDEVFAAGTPRPDFAQLVLRSEFTTWLRGTPLDRLGATVVFQSEQIPDAEPDAEHQARAGVWISAVGTLADQRLADQLTDLVCDLVERLPDDVRAYHLDNPRPPAPEGGYPNQLPTYYVRPSDRV